MIIDCDANATYAPEQPDKELITQALDALGNPSSLHRAGQKAKLALDEARDAIRRLVGGGDRYRVVFTSGASEANNTVIGTWARPGAHVVSSEIEHPCLLAPLRRAAEHGAAVTLAPPTAAGEILPDVVGGLLHQTTALLSVMCANNETGVINDLAQLVRVARARSSSIVVHSDVAQMVGKVPLSMTELDLDIVTVSGHKFGSLSGVGALVLKESVNLTPLILGGAQEEKIRGGTENVLGIVHMGLVAKRVADELQVRTNAMEKVRTAFEERLGEILPDIEINGVAQRRLPNTSSVYIPGVRADDLVVALDLSGILVSAGAACSSGKPEPSHVLLAMRQPGERVKSTLRVSFRADQAPEVGGQVAEAVARVAHRVRGFAASGT